MSELHARNVITQASLKLTDAHYLAFTGGGQEPKRRVSALVMQESLSVPQSYILRLLEPKHTAAWVSNWIAFQTAHMPVPDSLYTTHNGVLVPDIKKDGSEVYGKGLFKLLSQDPLSQEAFARKPHPLDTLFKELTTDDNLPSVRDRAIHWAKIASLNHLRFPLDDPGELKINPDGTWDFLFLDLTMAGTDLRRLSYDQLFALNMEHVDQMLKTLQQLSKLL